MISLFELLAIAVGMGMDVFSVSAAVASGSKTPRQTFRLSFHFGLFQFFMPLIGWAIGATIMAYVAAIDHWIALGLLAGIGGHMIHEGLKKKEKRLDRDRSRGWSLVALSVATSLDALGVGLMFGVTGLHGWRLMFAAALIGVVSSAMSLAAILLARRLRSRLGQRMEILGGLILIGLGIRFFYTV